MIFRHHRLVFEGLLHQQPQALEINRLGQIIKRPLPHRRHRVLHRAKRRHQNKQRVPAALPQLRQQFQPAHARHFYIGYHQII